MMNNGKNFRKNKVKKIAIIGNGFDVYHGLASRYEDFYKSNMISSNVKRAYDILTKGFRKAYSWYDFEEEYRMLIQIESDIMTDIGYFHKKTGLSDENRKIYEPRVSVINNVFQNIAKEFELYLREKYESDKLKFKPDKIIDENIKSSDKFLNFNYTRTLQDVYNVSDKKIIYVHGDLTSGTILGHSNYFDQPISESDYNPINNYGARICYPEMREHALLGDKNLQRLEKWNRIKFYNGSFVKPNKFDGIRDRYISGIKELQNNSPMSADTLQKAFENPFGEIKDEKNKIHYYNPLALDFNEKIEIVVIGHGLGSDVDLLSKIPVKKKSVTIFMRKSKNDPELIDKAKRIFETEKISTIEYEY